MASHLFFWITSIARGAHPDWNHSMLVEAPTAQERRQVRFDGALCNCCCVSLRRHSTVVQSELEGRRPHQDRSGQSLERTKLEPVRRNRPAQQSEPEEFLECLFWTGSLQRSHRPNLRE